jgi:dolichyl-phosphate beta-glucosyltransferase
VGHLSCWYPVRGDGSQAVKLVSLIIPAYNEVGRIKATVGEALDYFDKRRLPCEIIVSADGDDGTREAAREIARTRPEVTVIGSPGRRGKGLGIRAGVRLTTGDVVGFSDADNKTPITEFDKFDPLLRQGHDVVIGSRSMQGALIERAQPLYRRIGSRGFGVVMHAFVGLHDIVDTQCGFKFFHGDVARDLFALQRIDGYMFDAEILYLAQLRQYRVTQVPVRWCDDGDSRLELIAGNIRNVRDIVSIRWRHRNLSERKATDAQAVSREG